MSQPASLFDLLNVGPGMLGEETQTAIEALHVRHDSALFAWAVQQIVLAGTERDPPYEADVRDVVTRLSRCKSVEALLVQWVCDYRQRKALPTIDGEQIRELIRMTVAEYESPDGFRTLALCFTSTNPTLSTERFCAARVSSPPPLLLAGRIGISQ